MYPLHPILVETAMIKAGENTLAWLEVLKLHRVSLMFKLKYAKFCKEVRSLSCGPFLCTGINYSHKTNSPTE